MNRLQKSRSRDKRPRKKDIRGRHKLAVFFLDHRQPKGQAYYFYSTLRQDQNQTAKQRLRYLVNKKWQGLVSWAGLYYCNVLIAEYSVSDNCWRQV
ncbi:MAG: hypothetical protein HRU41_37215 [Saprospiraceae bacterium]|nr:hypothetical protein [Saprospiraceae bacterium]